MIDAQKDAQWMVTQPLRTKHVSLALRRSESLRQLDEKNRLRENPVSILEHISYIVGGVEWGSMESAICWNDYELRLQLTKN